MHLRSTLDKRNCLRNHTKGLVRFSCLHHLNFVKSVPTIQSTFLFLKKIWLVFLLKIWWVEIVLILLFYGWYFKFNKKAARIIAQLSAGWSSICIKSTWIVVKCTSCNPSVALTLILNFHFSGWGGVRMSNPNVTPTLILTFYFWGSGALPNVTLILNPTLNFWYLLPPRKQGEEEVEAWRKLPWGRG